jgi:hypothetical protein
MVQVFFVDLCTVAKDLHQPQELRCALHPALTMRRSSLSLLFAQRECHLLLLLLASRIPDERRWVQITNLGQGPVNNGKKRRRSAICGGHSWCYGHCSNSLRHGSYPVAAFAASAAFVAASSSVGRRVCISCSVSMESSFGTVAALRPA